MEANEPKPIKRLTSLVEFVPEDVDVQIEYPDHIELIPMRTISYMRLLEINQSVPDPVPPIGGVDGNKRPVVDYNNPGYQRAVNDAYIERMMRLIVEMVRLPIPGESEAEKVGYLRGLDTVMVGGLMAAVNQLTKQGEAQLISRAAGFQPKRDQNPAHLSENGLVKAAVE